MVIANYHTFLLQEIPTAARKLGKNVLVKCASKLKPYLKQAVKVLGLPLDGYSKIVATICNGSNGGAEHKDGNVSSLEKLVMDYLRYMFSLNL